VTLAGEVANVATTNSSGGIRGLDGGRDHLSWSTRRKADCVSRSSARPAGGEGGRSAKPLRNVKMTVRPCVRRRKALKVLFDRFCPWHGSLG